MKKVYIAIIVAAVLVLAFIYPDARKGIFPERLGSMSLAGYMTGEAAAQEISNMYGLKEIPLAKAYYAVYKGRNGTMRIFAVEAPDHNVANDAFNSMNAMLGVSNGHEGHEYSGDVGQTESHEWHDTGMNNTFTKPVKVDIMELVKPEVYMMQANDVYNYYYLKMDYRMGRVYWISFDYPDAGYQRVMVRQAILKI